MKYKGFRLLLFTFLLSTLYLIPLVASATSLQKAPNNLGLVGYWSFNEGGGTVATDFSGNGNTGTLTNGPTWTTGKLGYGLRFDATNHYVSVANSPSIATSGDITASVMVKSSNAAQSNRAFVGKYNSPTYSWLMYTYNGYVSVVVNGVELAVWSGGAAQLFDGKWHLLTFTLSGTQATIYMDGIVKSSGVATPIVADSSPLLIGIYPSANAFDGSLDDVRIYNRALGASEVTALYNAGASRLKAPTSEGLVGYWSMNNCSGLRATDFSGQGSDGTLTNGPTWGAGRAGCGLTFDGSNDYVDTSSVSTYSFGTGDFTIGFWIKTTDTTGNILSRGPTIAAAGNWALVLFNSELYWQSAHGSTNLYNRTATSILDGQWHYVVVKRSGTTNTMHFDNVQQGVSVTDATDYSPTNILRMGNGANGFLNGSIDDVRIYSRALSSAEVTSLYTLGAAGSDAGRSQINSSQKNQLTSGLVGYWTFNGGDTPWTSATAGTTRDVSGNGNTGTLTNMSRNDSPVAGKSGQALSFDGTNDYVSLPTTTLAPDAGFSESFWMKSSGGIMHLVDLKGTSSGFVTLARNDGNHLYFGFRGSTAIVETGTSVANGVWNHVVITYNGGTKSSTSSWAVYVNGVSVSLSNSTTIGGSDNNNRIGIDSDFTSSPYIGSLDEVRVYNRALSAAEVKQLYYLGK